MDFPRGAAPVRGRGSRYGVRCRFASSAGQRWWASMSGSALMKRALKISVPSTWLGEHATRHCGAGVVMPPRFQSQSRCAKLSAFELGRRSFVL